MPTPVPFRERRREMQIVLAVAVPFLFGALVGVFVGISAAVYWILLALAALGGVLAGLEHPNAGEGARRGVVGGTLFGAGLLLAHAISGTDAKVSLGEVPLLLIPIDAIAGALLGTLGGAISRRTRRDP